MSFLPYASPAPGAWLASMGVSTVAHAGVASFVFFSGTIAFLPEITPRDFDQSDVAFSLEILEADAIEEVDPSAIPEDAVEVEPEPFETEDPIDQAALVPDEADVLEPQEALIPEEPDILEPEEPLAPVEEPEIEPQTLVEPEPETLGTVEPDVLAEPIEEPLETTPLAPVTEIPVADPPAPIEEAPLIVEDLSPIDDTIISPLADGGAAPLVPEFVEDPEPEILALDVQEPEPLATTQIETPVDEEPPVTDDPGPLALLLEDEDPEPPVITPDPQEDAPVEPELETPPEAAVEPEPEPAAQPARTPLANPSISDISIGNLIRRIRATPQQSCTLALPRRVVGGPGGGVTLAGADIDVLDDLGRRIVDGLDPVPVQTRDIIDPRQCAALDAIRQSDDYPVSRIGLAIDSAQLRSGDTLTARVIGAGGLFLTLLVIDDNGVVQDLAPFTGLEGDEPVINVPVARAGPSRATRQLLVALGTRDEALDLSGLVGQRAQDVFSALPADRLASLVFAFAAFDVR